MKKRESKYLVTLKLRGGSVSVLESYRREYDPKSAEKIPAHITLVPPFIVEGSSRPLCTVLSGAAGEHRIFRLTIAEIGSFGDEVVFFKPNCPAKLRSFRDKLKRLVGNIMKKGDSGGYWRFDKYHPHITIANSGKAAAERAKKDLSGRKFNFVLFVDGLQLYKKSGSKWVLIDDFLFGG